MSLQGAVNIIAIAVIAGGATAAIGWLRMQESAKENAVTVAAIEQGVNFALAAKEEQQPALYTEPVTTPPGTTPSMMADVEADDYIDIAIAAETAYLNDLICRHTNYATGKENEESLELNSDLQLNLLDAYAQEVKKMEGQELAGGYAPTRDATRVGVADASVRLSLLFAIKDVRDSRGVSGNGPQIRLCNPDGWRVITAGSEVRSQVLRAKAARRNEAIRSLQRSEVAADGL